MDNASSHLVAMYNRCGMVAAYYESVWPNCFFLFRSYRTMISAESNFSFFIYFDICVAGIVTGSGFRFLTLFLPLPGDQLQAKVSPLVRP